MIRSRSLAVAGTLALFLAAACGGSADNEASEGMAEQAEAPAAGAMAAAESPSVTILEPTEGAEIGGDSVVVRLQASGVQIVPAGDTTPGTGHHHLYLDADLGEPGVAVPAEPGHIVHLGTGVSEYVFTDVAPGQHRLIAVIADGLHVPLQPWVTDTVNFVVR